MLKTEERRLRTKRNRLDITAEILNLAEEGAKRTHIMYRASLSGSQIKEYLNLLTGPNTTIEMIVGYHPQLMPEEITRRCRHRIIAEILNLAEEGAKKTRIMHQAMLGVKQINEYLVFLQEVRLLKEQKKGKRKIYITSPEGSAYLKNYKDMRNIWTSKSGEMLKNENGVYKTSDDGIRFVESYRNLESFLYSG